MRLVTIHQAKTNLSRLLEAVENGEEVVIARGKKPVARLLRVAPAGKPKRQLGFAKGKVRVALDFDAPLEDFADYGS